LESIIEIAIRDEGMKEVGCKAETERSTMVNVNNVRADQSRTGSLTLALPILGLPGAAILLAIVSTTVVFSTRSKSVNTFEVYASLTGAHRIKRLSLL
jgi:hypothetical protein